jgi:hypothetical protein
MTKDERDRLFSDACAHLSLARSALDTLIKESGPQGVERSDRALAYSIGISVKTQLDRIKRRRHR